MSTGEDLISKITTDAESGYYSFIHPFKVVYSVRPDKGNALTVNLVEWVFPNLTDKQEFKIFHDDIITLADPSKVMVEYYHSIVEKLLKDERYHVVYPSSKPEPETKQEELSESELEMIEQMLEEVIQNKPKKRLH
jgi:hypothetical protein